MTNRRAPVVSHHVWYKVGSADSPLGKSGLPHFLEHLMFKGTAEPGTGRVLARSSRATAATRTRSPAPTTPATSRPSPRTASRWSCEMEADRMTNLVLDDAARCCPSATWCSRSARSGSTTIRARGWASRSTRRSILNHPYRLPIIGWRHEMASYTREDALDFYRTWYAPNNAVLIVAGDIDAAELRPLAEKLLWRDPGAAGARAPAAAGAAAAGGARGRADRSARPAAVLVALLPGAELTTPARPSTPMPLRCWPRSRRHQHLASLPLAGDRAEARDLGGRLLSRQLARRSDDLPDLCQPAARRRASTSSRRRSRPSSPRLAERADQRRGGRARDAPAGRRGGLCA